MVVCRLSAVQAGMWKHRRLVMRQSGWVSVLERVSYPLLLMPSQVFLALCRSSFEGWMVSCGHKRMLQQKRV